MPFWSVLGVTYIDADGSADQGSGFGALVWWREMSGRAGLASLSWFMGERRL